MAPKITKKLDAKNPDHLMTVIEEFRDEIRVVNEINQKVDSLSTKVDRGFREINQRVDQLSSEFSVFRREMLDFKSETESSFETIKRFMSQVDLFELQERVERIEKHLELKR